jgi:hypothetical protein
MTMDIRTIANEINRQTKNYKMRDFPALKNKLHPHEKKSYEFFSKYSIFDQGDDKYAFHSYGREELQYNIGFENIDGVDVLRYGVAFSLESSNNYPAPVIKKSLEPKIPRFNDFMNLYASKFDDLWVFIWFRKKRSEIKKIHELEFQPGAFIFIGKFMSLENINYDEILSTFDRLLDLYEYVEDPSKTIIPPEEIDEDEIEPTKKEEKKVIDSTPEFTSAEQVEMYIKNISKELLSQPVSERIKLAKIYSRNPKYADWVKNRQKYICQICGVEPFLKKDNNPYAEAHHIFELARSRIDDPRYMICVCPTCHRIIHYGNDKALNDRKKLLE